LQISWIGSDEGEILATDEFDIPVTVEGSVIADENGPDGDENRIEEEENV
jgi:segregation and condensation protein A